MDSKKKFHFIHKSQGDRAERDFSHISQSFSRETEPVGVGGVGEEKNSFKELIPAVVEADKSKTCCRLETKERVDAVVQIRRQL